MIELGNEKNQGGSRLSNRSQPVLAEPLHFRGATRVRFLAAIVTCG